MSKFQMEQDSNFLVSHVLIFPYPAQGHVNSMLKLAELLSLSGLDVTFLNTDHNYQRLANYTNIQERVSKYPGKFILKSISDGLPSDHPRRGRVLHLFDSMKLKMKPAFTEILIESTPPVNCIIGDVFLGFVVEVGFQLQIPVFSFDTCNAANFWVYFSLPDAIEAGELPIGEEQEDDRDLLITKVPGMETFLRCRDLPSFCQCKDTADPTLLLLMKAAKQTLQSQALIFNTFEDLEGPILSQIRKHFPKIYTIGPLHEHLKTKKKKLNTQAPQKSLNNLWEENRACMTWLDNQPPQSVLYVSFGSLTVMTAEQVLEFWYGLLNSKKRFLWVIRPGFITNNDAKEIPTELVKGVTEKEYMAMVGWAPQEEVLGHKAIGGFLTHSGWNSTLEAIVEGVPMICWPYFTDQQLNSRFVGEVWKLGLDMKDVCDRRVVEKMVHDLMVERREEFMKSSAARMSELAKTSVSPGGSSYCNLDRLIEDIRLMCMVKRGS